MATASSYMVFPMVGWKNSKQNTKPKPKFPISAQINEAAEQLNLGDQQKEEQGKPKPSPLRPVEAQQNVKSKNMGREYGGQWLSSVTRHVRIYAAYIDPVTCEFDQTQMDKLTLILDPSNEFLWNPQTCNKVYAYFQELVDHYEGAPLTEYTLRLIGSDIEHYIRKMLYDGEIKYNMNARVLNFSMGKPRIMFNANDLPQDLQSQ
ncbi:NAD(P)H-quinone oxidoreductase subunit M, chloroplastic [Benincasa hispida]|uniref:NAD(P)H-quinone oxidoreductase subunit M, chloroplastic n=1 Tax=Benincasa hispida TaxID=102211 RepID=UPI001900A55A|nr:NAD(P)H-quinone oxidoreductase subunit M, chloroplastic [Benincasa hispida]